MAELEPVPLEVAAVVAVDMVAVVVHSKFKFLWKNLKKNLVFFSENKWDFV